MKFLIADDDRFIREIIKDVLIKEGHTNIFETENGEETLKLAKLEKPDIMILDVVMPKMSGFDICHRVKNNPDEYGCPFILMLTSRKDDNAVIEGLEKGADDYLKKPFNTREFILRVNNLVEKCDYMNLAKTLENKVEEATLKSMTDSMTKLYKREKFNEEFEKEIDRFNRYDDQFSVIMFDIDNFKKINDTYGHDIGDMVIIGISDVVKKSIRKPDILSRWGGEEFMLLLPKTHLNNAGKLAEKLRKKIEEEIFFEAGKVTCSFGVYSFRKWDTAEMALKRVDIALYNAKRDGKNCVKFFTEI